MALVEVTLTQPATIRMEPTQQEADYLATHVIPGATLQSETIGANGTIYQRWHLDPGTYMVTQKIADAFANLGWI